MIRAVLDTNVLVAALLARDGAPAAIVRALHDGRFDFVACPALLDELARVPARPRIACRVEPGTAAAYVDWLRRICVLFPDPERVAHVSPDPDDDYLIALAEAAAAHVLVSGDHHLIDLAGALVRVLPPAAFLEVVQKLP
ncbi:putative toxin-antitoxin system toxin component, PIN family [Coriobacteriia bacterium Es71-Z0120]|uniref:putative toxin-antitoxin system toxin component, PIN family n=1 Tax=Parvivirga hydrogeniphila TaxID=2939460 RepID=UPI002260BBDD|nr:putative toxin-antitoxin system toxin component, PIN family [Parvivirga hydrogeniphila]MCL4078704.1 putative toxin-antitoxin system toxin component, PIN family [Parvivirga hydrogeniphila]